MLGLPLEIEPQERWEYWRILACEVNALSGYFPHGAPTVLDIGANKGLWGAAADFMYGDRIKTLHMIEPSSHNIGWIKDIQKKGGLSKSKSVEIHQIGLGSKTEELTLYSDRPGSALATFTGPSTSLAEEELTLTVEEKVCVLTLDDFAASKNISRIDFMKMDTEGFEMNIFRGATRLLSEDRIGGFMFEFGMNQIRTKDHFIDFWKLLTGYGFDIYFVPSGEGGISPIRMMSYSTYWESFAFNRYFMATKIRY